MKKKIAELETELRNTRGVAESAIYGMKRTAELLMILREAPALVDYDPEGKGPRFVCQSTADNLTRLAAEYTTRLKGDK